MPNIIRAFLYWLEENKIDDITRLRQSHYKQYFHYITSRKSETRGGGLSNNYVNKHIQALEKFYEFLVHKGAKDIPPVILKPLRIYKDLVSVLTPEQIKELYKASHMHNGSIKQSAYASRDRAILTVFYGCCLLYTSPSPRDS